MDDIHTLRKCDDESGCDDRSKFILRPVAPGYAAPIRYSCKKHLARVVLDVNIDKGVIVRPSDVP